MVSNLILIFPISYSSLKKLYQLGIWIWGRTYFSYVLLSVILHYRSKGLKNFMSDENDIVSH